MRELKLGSKVIINDKNYPGIYIVYSFAQNEHGIEDHVLVGKADTFIPDYKTVKLSLIRKIPEDLLNLLT